MLEKVSFQPESYDVDTCWIQLHSGIAYPILNPKPEHINIEDIAHALSNLCRFAGHVSRFYSVAQHALLCSYNVPKEDALEALLHDASEAYIVDLPRPLKRSGWLEGYKAIETMTENVIAERFGLRFPYPPSVKEADARALLTEQRDLMGRQAKPWADIAEPYPQTIYPVPPEAAKAQFMAAFNRLMREREERSAA